MAFGGRALTDGVPKYLNSPETAVFRKGENLFAIDRALPEMKKSGSAIVVEGYMDALAMHQAGLTGCVAPLGTALTDMQVRLLRRYAKEVVLVFDSDDAGEKATLRAVEMLERQDVPTKIVALKGGKDPADIVAQEGRGGIEQQIGGAVASFPFLVERAVRRFGTSTPAAKSSVCGFLFPFVSAAASQVRASDYGRIVAETIGVEESAVRADFETWQHGNRTARSSLPAAAPESPQPDTEDLFLMLAVCCNMELFPSLRNSGLNFADLEDERARALFVALEESYRAEEKTLDSVTARLEDPALRDMVLRRSARGEFDQNGEAMVADGVRRVRQRLLKRKREELSAEILRRERDTPPDYVRIRELVAEKMHVDDEIARLRRGRRVDPRES